ncbi:50S ribosomal protein L29 [Deinococcus roseus]|uniref:Large ribosomal subunit protein uL29 n=1 Tax=Deinococcus roseus TaxID=392414 RepID=A0ABQ2D9D8_9DEIO|nr:50S ribosomal protein L29 [Deinococcus roseus]GGJ50603.1 50S ribosomal protein L29 [Deinococcus roseus]
MKLSEIRQLKPAEIAQEVESRKKELMELRFQNSVGQLANPARIREIKREVAQLLTVSAESKGK